LNVFEITSDARKPSKIYAKTFQNSGLEGHFWYHFGSLGGSQHKPLFFAPFFWFRACLGAVLAAKLAPSWHPKGTPKNSKTTAKNDLNSNAPWDPLGTHIFRVFWIFGANLGAKMPPKSTKNPLKTKLMLKKPKNQKSRSRCSEGLIFKVRGT